MAVIDLPGDPGYILATGTYVAARLLLSMGEAERGILSWVLASGIGDREWAHG
jgi:hypothetical protein